MKILRFFALIPFFIPINLYIIGNGLGWGLQSAILRIQENGSDLTFMFIWRELEIVLSGAITGRTAYSILLWIGGVISLIAGSTIIISNRGSGTKGIIAYGIGCALLVISMMFQYGPLFHGPAGIAIPIGLPLLIVIGYLLWKDAASTGTADECDDDLADEDDAAPLPTPAGAVPGGDD